MTSNLTYKIETLLINIFVFVLIVDPANQLFKIKDIIFILLTLFLIIQKSKVKSSFIIALLTIYFVITVTYLRGILSGYRFDLDFTLYIFKTFTPLLLLLWINKLSFFDKMLFPSIVVSIITIFVTVILLFYPETLTITYNYFVNEKQLLGMSHRQFLGLDSTSVYYRSITLLIIPSTVLFYRSLFDSKTNRKMYIILSSLFFISLFLGGTRACILSTIVSILIISSMKLYQKKIGRIVLPILTLGFVICFSLIVFLLLSDTQETSNEAKYGHLKSYETLFQEDPAILIFGSGAGSMFYSTGGGGMISQSEWTYIEFIRMFGIIGAFIILTLYFLPLFLLYKKRKILRYWFPFLLGYLLYLLIGGTNPYLVGSNGMLALLIIYSYTLNPRYEYKL